MNKHFTLLVFTLATLAAFQLTAQNVGVNTDSPAAPFHVGSSGQVNVPGGLTILGHPSEGHLELDFNLLQSKNGVNPLGLSLQRDGGALGIGMTAVTNGPKLQIKGESWHIQLSNDEDGTVNEWYMGASRSGWSAGDNKFVISPSNLSSNASIQLDTSGHVLLVPQELGAVGIGVTSTGFMPDGFLLAVDGKAIFEEARVQLSGEWPDYVFEDTYPLTPLHDLEENIAELGHLPGIPSAETVENNGFDLGDMQRRMLEKIEELTLYMISANKEIDALKTANARLEAKLDSIHK